MEHRRWPSNVPWRLLSSPAWTSSHFTRQCIKALMKHTQPTCELIIVNNGSSGRHARLPTWGAGCSIDSRRGDHEFAQSRFPRRVQSGVGCRPWRLSRPAQQRRCRDRWLAQAADRPGRVQLGDRLDRAHVELRCTAATRRGRALCRPRGNASLCCPLAPGAPRTMVHRPEALGLLSADETSCLRGNRRP